MSKLTPPGQDTGGGQQKGGQPGGGGGGGGGGLDPGSKTGQPAPTDPSIPPPTGATGTPATPPSATGGDFSKGYPAFGTGLQPNGYFSPYQISPYSSGYNPYSGYPAMGAPGGGGYGGGGAKGGQPTSYAPGTPQSYDPLGIGNAAYTDPNYLYYGMTGVNAANPTSSTPLYATVGGQGGYGVGYVGPEYTGALFQGNPTTDQLNQLAQQYKTTAAYAGPTDASGQPIDYNAFLSAYNAMYGANPTNPTTADVSAKGGQPAAGTPAAATANQQKTGQPAAATTTNAATTPTSTAAQASQLLANTPGSMTGAQQAAAAPAPGRGGTMENGGSWYMTPDGRLVTAAPGQFSTQYGDLIEGSGGSGRLWKPNAAGDENSYGFTGTQWTPYTGGDTSQFVDPTDPRYADAAGQLYATQGYGTTPIQGDTGMYTDRQGTKSFQYKQTPYWSPR